MQILGKGRGEYEHCFDEDGNEWLWALCEVSGCKNNVCVRMNDRFCWPHLMSGGEAIKLQEPTPSELVQSTYAAGYAEGVKDGVERADQWASNKYGLNGGNELVAWIMKLLPASRDELANRMR